MLNYRVIATREETYEVSAVDDQWAGEIVEMGLLLPVVTKAPVVVSVEVVGPNLVRRADAEQMEDGYGFGV